MRRWTMPAAVIVLAVAAGRCWERHAYDADPEATYERVAHVYGMREKRNFREGSGQSYQIDNKV